MGTNYYIIETEKHIGKRSAAGAYCWDCSLTLCKDGKTHVHDGNSKTSNFCPNCGQKAEKEDWTNSTGGRELGFNTNTPEKKTGVKSCSSFTWAIDPMEIIDIIVDKVNKICKNNEENIKIIKDEYDREFSFDEFKNILEECPIRFYNLIGREFS